MANFNKIEILKFVSIISGCLIYTVIIAIALFTLLSPKIPKGVSPVFTILLCFIGAMFCSGFLISGVILFVECIRLFSSRAYNYNYHIKSFIVRLIASIVYIVIGIFVTYSAVCMIYTNYLLPK